MSVIAPKNKSCFKVSLSLFIDIVGKCFKYFFYGNTTVWYETTGKYSDCVLQRFLLFFPLLKIIRTEYSYYLYYENLVHVDNNLPFNKYVKFNRMMFST